MLINFLKHALIIALVLTMEVSFFSGLSGLQVSINIALTWLIFIALSYNFKAAAIYSVLVGFLLEYFSTLPFGVISICFLVTLILAEKIFSAIFTNKSLYSLIALTVAGTLIYWMLTYLALAAISLYQPDQNWLVGVFWGSHLEKIILELFYNSVAAVTLFVFFHLGSNRFQAVFIDTTKKA